MKSPDINTRVVSNDEANDLSIKLKAELKQAAKIFYKLVMQEWRI